MAMDTPLHLTCQQIQTHPRALRVLLVEDNSDDAFLLTELLTQPDIDSFELVQVERLEQAQRRLRQEHFDVILLDLGLPDSQGLETFTRIHQGEPGVPIVVLSGLDDRQLAAQAVRQGAQDYLTKSKVTTDLLVRAISYAIERHRLLADAAAAALFDELTGLYNRRGLTTVAGPMFKSVGRLKKGIGLLFIDLDNMKHLNDTWGHKAGDHALKETADLLRQTFRESDILARVGGDEFAVLTTGVSAENGELLAARLQERLSEHNARGRHNWQLALSVGLAHAEPERPGSLEALLARADGEMYAQKRAKRNSQGPHRAARLVPSA